MSEQPSHGLFTHYVLENPWPLGIGLILLALIIAWFALQRGNKSGLGVAAIAGVIGIIVLALGAAVTTAGEHGERVTKELVDAVVANDLPGAFALFDDDASFAFSSPSNPGLDIDYIKGMIDRTDRYTIKSNTIRLLEGFTESSDAATVHLGCLTETDIGYTPSTWILLVERNEYDNWRITKVTWMTINNSPPPAGRFQ